MFRAKHCVKSCLYLHNESITPYIFCNHSVKIIASTTWHAYGFILPLSDHVSGYSIICPQSCPQCSDWNQHMGICPSYWRSLHLLYCAGESDSEYC